MFKRVIGAFMLVLALGVPVTALAASDQSVADRVADQIRGSIYYTIFDDVDGTVDNGLVTLRGTVTDPYKASRIVAEVKRIAGVREVDSKIQSLPVSGFDNELRARIANRIYGDEMFWNYGLQATPPIHIIVNRGHVTLTGVVNSEVERRVAEMSARNAGLAFSVKNELRLD
jgi:hyperosmotically inducible periplasmic protein